MVGIGLFLKLPVALGVHGPGKLVPETGIENLFNGNIMLVAPGGRDPRVNIVDLGCSQGRCLAFLLHTQHAKQLKRRATRTHLVHLGELLLLNLLREQLIPLL